MIFNKHYSIDIHKIELQMYMYTTSNMDKQRENPRREKGKLRGIVNFFYFLSFGWYSQKVM